MATTALLTLLGAPLLFFALWYLSASIAPPPPPQLLSNKRIILLIAHPDDESMFFAPTLQSLTSPSLNNHLKILCLSTGNADGLGEVRRKELEAAAVMLGVRRREDVFVMNDEKRFKDGMGEVWDEVEISRVLASAFAPQLNGSNTPSPPSSGAATPVKSLEEKSSKTKSKSKKTAAPVMAEKKTTAKVEDVPRATIDVLLTFDVHGISSHPNHIALYNGARLFLKNLMKGHAGYACPVTLYSLTTVNIVRKYVSILDVIPTFIAGIVDSIFNTQGATGGGKSKAKAGDKLVFVNDMFRYWKAREAMVSGHKSQMVWFRWGWITLGRYMVVNDLRRERIIGT